MIQGTYKHFKGATYKVLCIAHDTETAKFQVIYKDVNGAIWAHSVDTWDEIVMWPDGVNRPRFVQYVPEKS